MVFLSYFKMIFQFLRLFIGIEENKEKINTEIKKKIHIYIKNRLVSSKSQATNISYEIIVLPCLRKLRGTESLYLNEKEKEKYEISGNHTKKLGIYLLYVTRLTYVFNP